MKHIIAEKNRARRVLLAIVILAALLRLYRLGHESLWFDEGWSALIAKMGWTSLRSVLLTQPFPLYYASLNLWAKLGDSEFTLRLLSAAAGVLSIPLLYKIACFCANRRAAILAALLLAVSPLHIWYSQEARMYALATLLALGATWSFLRALQRDNWAWWGAYALLSAMALYTFYYTAFILLAHGFFLLYLGWRGRPPAPPGLAAHGAPAPSAIAQLVPQDLLPKWLGTQVVIALLFAPGARVLLAQLGGGTWAWVARKYGPPTLNTLVQTALSFSLGDTWNGPGLLRWGALGIFAFAFAAGIASWSSPRNRFRFVIRVDGGAFFLLSYLCLPIGAVFLLSQLRPSYLPRYLLIFLPPYYAIVGRGLATLRPRALALGALAIMLLASGLSLSNLYYGEQKEDWRGVAQHIEAHAQGRDVICLVDEDTSAVFGYYYQGPLPVVGVSGALRDEAELASIVNALISRYDRIWLLVSHTTNEALPSYLKGRSDLRLVGEWRMTGIRLALLRILG